MNPEIPSIERLFGYEWRRQKMKEPRPFPQWNSIEEFEIPRHRNVIVTDSSGSISSLYLTGIYLGEVSHWMYAPEPPKSEPKRGVWVSVESDGLPPFHVEVLVANKPSGDLLRARRHPMGWWAHHSSSYHESGLDKFTHWYLPHEFKP